MFYMGEEVGEPMGTLAPILVRKTFYLTIYLFSPVPFFQRCGAKK